jgi:molecular chaperone DnaK
MKMTQRVFESGCGIDFGTTNSVAAICDESGRTRPFTQEGHAHPSVVWFRLDEMVRVGREAKQNINGYSSVAGNYFVSSIKRQLGKDKTFNIFGRPMTTVQVASEIFKHLVLHARESHKTELRRGIVTIPVNFDGRARRELRQAADKAGFYIKTFIHEPFAALVGFCYADDRRLDQLEGTKILVFDWGGGTLDITVATVKDGNLIELSTSGLVDRAGDLFDQRLMEKTRSRFLDRNRLSPLDVELTPSAKDRYLAECENAKITLSEQDETEILLAQAFRSQTQTYNVREGVTREDFESIIELDVRDAMREVDRAVEQAQLSHAEIGLVLMIGGTSNIPAVRRDMDERFGHRLVDVPNAETIIAEGAAIVDARGLQPVFARSIGIQLADNSYYEVFPSGMIAKSPESPREVNMFCTDNRDGQARLIVSERQWSSTDGSVRTLNVLPIPVSPYLSSQVPERVTVSFSLDEDLILHVAGKGATQTMNYSVELHDLCFGLKTVGA